MKAKYIPNVLSAIRILLALAFPFVFFGLYPNIIPAMIVFLSAGATDVIDGFLARKNKWITNLGKILDPVADKLMQAVVIVSLTLKELLPLWLAVACVIKELCVLIAAALMLTFDNKLAVSGWAGKLSVCVFYAAMFSFAMFGEEMNGTVTLIISVITLLAAICALAVYFPAFFASVKNGKQADVNPDKANP